MRMMKKTAFAVLMAIVMTSGAFAGGDWGTDFEAAKAQAKKSGLPILADFSGSDWCGWCIRLDKEVFSQEAFKKFAEENMVLFLADFPSRKKQPEDVAAQNRKLAETYKVSGFPTVLILDAEGKELARTGYKRGGAEAYVEHLKEFLKAEEKTDSSGGEK
jgi:thioredoxin-related protein